MLSSLKEKLIKTGSLTLTVFVKTQKPQSNIDAVKNNILYINLKHSPINGEANKELIRLLHKEFKVVNANIRIIRGLTMKKKLLKIVW